MTVLTRSGGPATAVAARNGVGFTSAEAFLVECTTPGDADRAVVPGSDGHVVGAGDALTWVWFPERSLPPGRSEPTEDDLGRFWQATAFTLDLVFTDGSCASDEPSFTDQYAVRLTPGAQEGARMMWVDQWNRRTSDLSAFVGRAVDRIEAHFGRPGTDYATLPFRGWLDDVAIGPGPRSASRPIDRVRTTRGTHASSRFSRGNTAPLVAVPHGGVFGLPMTDASNSRWPYSYQEHNRPVDNRSAIEAFATSHLPSPWMGDRGVFQIMPSPLAEPQAGRAERALGFDHIDEEDGPHRYAVRLDGGVRATMTAGDFCIGLRFDLPDDVGSIIVDHHGEVSRVTVTQEDKVTVIEALLDDRAETPPQFVHVRVAGVLADRLVTADTTLRGSLLVDSTGPVDVLVGLSTVSAADAAANVRAGGGFDAMLTEAERRWSEKLDLVSVEGASDDQLVSLYSGLYRLFLFPNRFGEDALTGSPHHRSLYGSVLSRPIRDGDRPEIVESAATTTNGFWDTYRTAWPLLALLTPDTAGELAQGFVEHFTDGGWTPRWSAPGAEDVMTGTTSDTVFADLLSKGVHGIDYIQAYQSAVRNATVLSPDHRVGRKGVHPALFKGYVDTASPEGMSWTLDAAINDWAIATMARSLTERAEPNSVEADRYAAEAEWFARRSLLYRRVFHPALGFFLGRKVDGEWRTSNSAFNPDEWGHDYTETNAWGTMFTAPHDGAGLVALHGGEAGIHDAFTRFTEARETGETDRAGSYGFAIHEMTEARDVRMGTLGLSNQPAHHIPFVPMLSGRHDDSHRIVRECVQRLFVGSDLGQGYPGDEDNGEMSAWYLFVAIGLYPLVPATSTYVLVPPSVRRTALNLGGGKQTVLEVVGGSEHGRFIKSVRVNGRLWSSISIDHAIVASGAHIEFELADEPCGWAADSRPVSASDLHGYADPPDDVLSTDSGPLTDDLGDTVVALEPGEATDLTVSIDQASLYTITVDKAGTYSWTATWISADGTATWADSRPDEEFPWPRQTRVFRVRGGVQQGTFRLTAVSPLRLTQVEVIASSERIPKKESNTCASA